MSLSAQDKKDIKTIFKAALSESALSEQVNKNRVNLAKVMVVGTLVTVLFGCGVLPSILDKIGNIIYYSKMEASIPLKTKTEVQP